MNKKIICLAFLLVLSLPHSSAVVSEISNRFKTLFTHWQRPIQITAMVCWEPQDSLNLLRSMAYSAEGASTFVTSIVAPIVKKLPLGLQFDEHQTVIIVDLNCQQTSQLLMDAKYHLYWKFTWFLINSSDSDGCVAEEGVELLFRELPVLSSSEVFFMQRSITKDMEIRQVYRYSMATPLLYENHANFTGNTVSDQPASIITSVRRRNLQHTNLRASMVVTNNDTLNHLNDYREKHIDTITKVNYLLTNELVNFLNATLNYTIVPTWGYLDNQTGRWSGMIGELIEDLADLGASPLFFTVDRVSVIDYLAMTSETRSKFIFRSPKLSYTENVFLLPFSDIVWYCIVGLVVLVAISLSLTMLAEWKIPLSDDDPADASLLRPQLHDTLLLVFSATCQQGSATLPKSYTSRIVVFLAFLVLMFLYASYSANIVALLQSPSTKIKTLEDLLSSRLKFGVDNTVFNRYYFSHASEKTRKAIYEKKVLLKDGTPNFMNLEDGVEKIREGLFAFHMELGVGYKVVSETFMEYEKCGLQEIQYLQVIDPFYAVQKNTSFKEFFKVGLFRLREHGLQERENSRLYTKKPKCSGGGGNFVSVGLVDVEPALLVIVWGAVLSTVFLSMEILMARVRKMLQRKEPVRPDQAK